MKLEPRQTAESCVVNRALALWPRNKWSQTRQLLAISGGADSVAMLRLLAKLSSNVNCIVAAHYNHGWRGADSDRDEQFVRELCTELNVHLVVRRHGEYTTVPTATTEEGARKSRYAFLVETAYAVGARYVLTAHNANDRVETVLHNMFRGSGLDGVATPTLFRPLDRELVLVRPLLGCWRIELLAYLEEINQAFCVDSSNSDISYRRNFLRHRVLPGLRTAYGEDVDLKIQSFSEVAEEALETIRILAADYWAQVATLHDSERRAVDSVSVCFPTEKRLRANWAVVREALKQKWEEKRWPLGDMGRRHWLQIRELHSPSFQLDTAPQTANLPGQLKAVLEADGNWIRVSCLS
jgi:tRNA(Ile)-lysidine synthase